MMWLKSWYRPRYRDSDPRVPTALVTGVTCVTMRYAYKPSDLAMITFITSLVPA